MEIFKEFELIYEKDIEIGRALYLNHKNTDLKVFAIINEDVNRVFNIGFRTFLENSTGVAHILEHSVLCGSKKYPIKDPFIELVKSSVNTFLNAMTYQDRTVYPLASPNLKDFKNLMDVYLDAVFNPLIYDKKGIFLQEGWHVENGNITGVVYNEMKGAYSSPSDLMDDRIVYSLYPSGSYMHDSGGNPKYIPELTYEEFCKFHKKNYHPSNAYVYLYGKLDLNERLEYLHNEYLSKYSKGEKYSLVSPYKYEINELKEYYNSDTEDENSSYFSYNFAINYDDDSKIDVGLNTIAYALVNGEGAPISKRLHEENIGMDCYASVHTFLKNPILSIQVDNAKKEDYPRFKEIVEEVIKETIENGLNKESCLASLNKQEFNYREKDTGTTPLGLIISLNAFENMNYDRDPLDKIDIIEHINYYRDDKFEGLNKLLKEGFIENEHRSCVLLSPKNMGESNKKLIDNEKELQELKNYQDEEDDDKLDLLPSLSINDIDRDVLRENISIKDIDDTKKLIYHEFNCYKIAYLDFLYSLDNLSLDEIVDLTILSHLLGKVDTSKTSYNDLSNKKNIHLGRLNFGVDILNTKESNDFTVRFVIELRCLDDKINIGIEMMEEILKGSIFEIDRVRAIVKELLSSKENNISYRADLFATLRSVSKLDLASKYKEEIMGISYYNKLKSLAFDDERLRSLIDKGQKLIKKALSNEVIISLGCDKDRLDKNIDILKNYFKNKNLNKVEIKREKLSDTTLSEGFILSASNVNYVAVSGKGVAPKKKEACLIYRIILSYEYLWKEVRVKGGAYGCASSLSKLGVFNMSSYRDPRISETLDIFHRIPDYLNSLNLSYEEFSKYIIAATSEFDNNYSTASRIRRSMFNYINGINREKLCKSKEELLDLKLEDVIALKDTIAKGFENKSVVVIGTNNIRENSNIKTITTLF